VATRYVDFYDVKKDVESLLGVRAAGLVCVAASHPALHPGRSARLVLDGLDVGWMGELHPRWVQKNDLTHAPVVFEIDADAVLTSRMATPVELPRQPVVIRDLAIWVGADVSYQNLLDTLTRTVASDATLSVVKDIKLFDVWRDKSSQSDAPEKSMAFRFWFQDIKATLDDATIESCVRRLLEALISAHGVRLRA
ncbi:MAG: phenylalanine--tRNA ligase subunit beta, partial [Burkholderiaceae bacterium]